MVDKQVCINVAVSEISALATVSKTCKLINYKRGLIADVFVDRKQGRISLFAITRGGVKLVIYEWLFIG